MHTKLSNEELAARTAIIEKLRIVKSDAVAIMPTGNVIPYKQAIEDHAFRPLLVLNRDEINPEGIKRVLKSQVYKRRYCDQRIARSYEDAIAQKPGVLLHHGRSGMKHRMLYYGAFPGLSGPFYKDYRGTVGTSEREREKAAEKLYDLNLRMHVLSEKDIVAKCQAVYHQSLQDSPWKDISDETRHQRSLAIYMLLTEVPEYMLKMLQLSNIEFIDNETTEDLEKDSTVEGHHSPVYHHISLVLTDKDLSRSFFDRKPDEEHFLAGTILEEITHCVDHLCTNFSDKEWSTGTEWREAIKNTKLETLRKIDVLLYPKAPLFPENEASEYRDDQISRELLANVARIASWNEPWSNRFLKNEIPELYSLYKQFVAEAKHYHLPRLEREESLRGQSGQSR